MNALKTLDGWRVEMEYSRALRRLVLAQLVWISTVVLTLQLQNAFSIERLFVLWYFGFIITVHLFAPSDPSSRWWRSIQVIVVLGFLGLCYFVAARAVEILAI